MGTGVPRILTLTLHQWQQLVHNKERLTETLTAVRRGDGMKEMIHLGGLYYAMVKPPFRGVNVSKFHKTQDGSLDQIQEVIAIDWCEWQNILHAANDINIMINDVVPW